VGETQGGGGDQLKVKPDVGNLELLINAVELLDVPSVLAAHVPELVIALFLKSLLDEPRIPTCPVIEVEVLLAVHVPYTNWTMLDVSKSLI
jgi:hypothetical protein